MNDTTIYIVVGVVIGALALLFLFANSARRDRATVGTLSRETRQRDRSRDALAPLDEESPPITGRELERQVSLERSGRAVVTREAAPPAPVAPVDLETIEITRRQLMNRGIVGMFGVGLGAFGAACLGFLWPTLSGGFGSKINAGRLSDIIDQVNSTREPVYNPEGRFYLVPYPKDAVPKAKDVYQGGVLAGMEAGVTALYQKCVHLGCRVPWCKPAQWFECPCHGSRYNRVGEKKGGPAPRGLDRFPVEVSGGSVVVDTGLVSVGPPIGTNTTGQEAEGPHCA